jgi:hypothetical protein
MKIPLSPPFPKGDDYPSLSQREVGRDLRKLFSRELEFQISNFRSLEFDDWILFGVWNLDIGIYRSSLFHLNFGFLAARTSSSLLTLTL